MVTEKEKGPETILIVDDDVSIGDMLEEILTKEGYGVSRAYSGTGVFSFILFLKKNNFLLMNSY